MDSGEMLKALRVLDRIRLVLQTQYLAGSQDGVSKAGTIIVKQNQWSQYGYSEDVRLALMSFPQNERQRWKNIYGIDAIGFSLHDNMQRMEFRKFIIRVVDVKPFLFLEDKCVMFRIESVCQTPISNNGLTTSSSTAMTSISTSSGAGSMTITTTCNIAIPSTNTTNAVSYGLSALSSGTGRMTAANCLDALPSQLRGRTPNQATRSGGGTDESTIANYLDSLPNQIIGKHKNNRDAVYQLLPVPKATESDKLALNLMKSPLVDNALRQTLTIMGGGYPCKMISKVVNFYNLEHINTILIYIQSISIQLIQ